MSAADGGPAFPRAGFELPNTGSASDTCPQAGMTLRAYFIAHAPAEPQPWFRPAVYDQPRLPDKFALLNADQRRELANFDNDGLDEEAVSAPVRVFIKRRHEAKKSLFEWEKAHAKARCVQWPAAWADAMIAEMERTA